MLKNSWPRLSLGAPNSWRLTNPRSASAVSLDATRRSSRPYAYHPNRAMIHRSRQTDLRRALFSRSRNRRQTQRTSLSQGRNRLIPDDFIVVEVVAGVVDLIVAITAGDPLRGAGSARIMAWCSGRTGPTGCCRCWPNRRPSWSRQTAGCRCWRSPICRCQGWRSRR